ncbi:MAG: class I SAM-dependent methyltransferase [bacterium]|nr:class I SAM-dependent methyltransferase [bacterium]
MSDKDPLRANIEDFYQRAAAYTHSLPESEAAWLGGVIRQTGCGAGALLVDIGVGTANAALPFLEAGGRLLGVEVAAAMAEKGRTRLDGMGLGAAAAFFLGDGHRIPLAEGCVDFSICRNVFHHMRSPAEVVAEMVRILRPGGHIAVMDHYAPDGAAAQAEIHVIEKLREPSLVHTVSLAEFRAHYAAAGADLIEAHTEKERLGALEWLESGRTPEANIPAVLDGLEKMRDSGGGWFEAEGTRGALAILRKRAFVLGKKR